MVIRSHGFGYSVREVSPAGRVLRPAAISHVFRHIEMPGTTFLV